MMLSNIEIPITIISDEQRYHGIIANALEQSRILPVKIQDEQARFTEQAQVQIEFYSKDAVFVFLAKVHHYNPANHFLSIYKPSSIAKKRLRERNRLKSEQLLRYTKWTEDGEKEARLVDISPVGIRMQSEERIEKDIILGVQLEARTVDELQLLAIAEVVWCKKIKDQQRYHLGIRFINLSQETQARIQEHIALRQ